MHTCSCLWPSPWRIIFHSIPHSQIHKWHAGIVLNSDRSAHFTSLLQTHSDIFFNPLHVRDRSLAVARITQTLKGIAITMELTTDQTNKLTELSHRVSATINTLRQTAGMLRLAAIHEADLNPDRKLWQSSLPVLSLDPASIQRLRRPRSKPTAALPIELPVGGKRN